MGDILMEIRKNKMRKKELLVANYQRFSLSCLDVVSCATFCAPVALLEIKIINFENCCEDVMKKELLVANYLRFSLSLTRTKHGTD